jgi:uncharacterized protein
MTGQRRLDIVLVPGTYALCRLAASSAVPAWGTGGVFWTVSGTSDEVSVLCEQGRVPGGVRAERDFALLRLAGLIPVTETGVIAAVAAPLAATGISLVPIATFDTDYFLVRQGDLARAVSVLRAAGHTVSDP